MGDILWGPGMCGAILLMGVYFTVRSGFFQFAHLPLWWRSTIGTGRAGDGESISPFQALCTALAATIGTGNIVGVAAAIYSGGAGAVLWLWVSALFGMMTKFFEIALAVKFRYRDSSGQWIGGPMVYIEKGLGFRWLGVIYALLCMIASLIIGAGIQSNSVASAVSTVSGVSPYITGAAIAAVAAAVIFGGAQRISSAAEKLVPAAAAFYVLGGAVLIAINHSALPGALNAIFHDAFSFKAVSGGAVGIITSKAIRFGISRGVSSNEAGVGTSSIAHASANAKSPIDQAMWGCVEVFIDTIVICTVTALVILTSGISIGGDAMDGARLAVNAFSRGFGSAAGWGVAAAIVLFAFTTIIGWSHYGHTCLRYLGGGRWMKVYDALVLMAVFIGSAGTAEKWWRLSDTLNGLMCIPNLIAVAALSGTVIKMLKAYRN